MSAAQRATWAARKVVRAVADGYVLLFNTAPGLPRRYGLLPAVPRVQSNPPRSCAELYKGWAQDVATLIKAELQHCLQLGKRPNIKAAQGEAQMQRLAAGL